MIRALPSRLPRRLVQLLAGLALYGFSMALMIRSGLGNMPWDVLHEGLVLASCVSFGPVVIATSAVVMLAWIPLRQRPGVGTVANAVLVGLAADACLSVIADATAGRLAPAWPSPAYCSTRWRPRRTSASGSARVRGTA